MGAAVPPELITSNVTSTKLLADEAPDSPNRSAQDRSNGVLPGFEAVEDDIRPSLDGEHGSSKAFQASKEAEDHVIASPSIENGVGANVEAVEEDHAASDDATRSTSESKAPILGGPSPSEASSVWPESGVVGSGATSEKNTVATSQAKSLIYYYLVKIPRRLENRPDLKTTDSQLKDRTEKRDSILATVQMKKAARAEVLERLKEARTKQRSCRDAFQAKLDEMQPLVEELRSIDKVARENPNFCRTEAELDAKISALERTMQHETLSLREEKQIIREIQLLKASREQVVANEILYAGKQESLRQREDLQARLKPLSKEADALKKMRDSASDEVKPLENKFNDLTAEINNLLNQKRAADEVLDGVYEERRALSWQENAKNNEFFQNRRDIQVARQYSSTGNKAALEELCTAQMERVMELWNNDREFRLEYIKNNERSTVRRLGTLDGRSLGPNEAPVSMSDVSGVSKPEERAVTELKPKQKVETMADPPKVITGALKSPKKIDEVEEDNSNEQAAALALIEKEKDREKRRLEEMEKAREAEVRKKRQAEKKQAKAQLRSEKEALRKEKEREKRLRKKVAPSAGSDETVPEVGLEAAEAVIRENGTTKDQEDERKLTSRPAKAFPQQQSRAQKSSTRTPSVKLPLRKKRSLQREILEHWQLLSVAVVVVLVAAAAVVFVRM